MTQKTQDAARTSCRRGLLNRIFTIRPTTSRWSLLALGYRGESRADSSDRARRRRRPCGNGPPTPAFSWTSLALGWWRTGRAKVERNAPMGTDGQAVAGPGYARSAPAEGAAPR